MAAKRILIIDDSAPSRRLLCMAVEALGCVAEEAEDVAEGLRAIRREAPALVLLDIKFPRSMGRGFFDQAKELKADLPIATLTGLDDELIADLVLKVCGAPYLRKPLNPQDLALLLDEAAPATPKPAPQKAAAWAPAFRMPRPVPARA